VFTHNVRANS